MGELVRFGVSMEEKLLDKFDALIKEEGYNNRSEAIRDLIRKAIIDSEVKREAGDVVGIIPFMYEHDRNGVTRKLLEIQHKSSNAAFNVHFHLDRHMCLEVVILKDEASNIRGLADEIRSIKGVHYCEILMTKPVVHSDEEHEHH